MDISRLAGLYPAGVICEVMNEDGSMSRLQDLLEFAEEHALKVGTIADLIAFRRRSERLVEKVVDAPFESYYGGDFRIHVCRNKVDQSEHLALVRWIIHDGAEALVRVHQFDMTADLLGWKAAKRDYVGQALKVLAEYDGPAVSVFVQDPDPASISSRVSGRRSEYRDRHALRDYGIGAQILQDMGVKKMRLLTSSSAKLAALEGFGLSVIGRMPIPDLDVEADRKSRKRLEIVPR